MSKKLFVIEGFDRSGKDTLMQDLYDLNLKDTHIYFNDLAGLPKYDKEQEQFLEWLNRLIDKQVNELNELFKVYDNVIMVRLVISDEVYSQLFNREHTTIKYMDKLKDVQIFNYCILFKNYNEYLSRLSKIMDNKIQYNEEDFNQLNNLYKDVLDNSNYEYQIYYILSNTTRKDIVNNFLCFYDKWKIRKS